MCRTLRDFRAGLRSSCSPTGPQWGSAGRTWGWPIFPDRPLATTRHAPNARVTVPPRLFARAVLGHGLENGRAGLGILETLKCRTDGLAALGREQFSHRAKPLGRRTGLGDDLDVGFLQRAGLGNPDVARRLDLFHADQ